MCEKCILWASIVFVCLGDLVRHMGEQEIQPVSGRLSDYPGELV